MLSFFTQNTTEKEIPYSLFYDSGLQPVSGHWHKEAEIVLCIAGETKITINNCRYTLKTGEVAVALGGDIHSYEASENHRRIVIIFDFSIFDGNTLQKSRNGEIKHQLENMVRVSRRWNKETEEKAAAIIRRLEELSDCRDFCRPLDIIARLCDLIILFCREVPKDENMGKTFANYSQIKKLAGIEEVFSLVENHYRERITLADAAQVMNFNPSYFARIFHRITGTTFLSYLNTYRINKARQLLLSEDCSVAEVSIKVGFTSIKTFNRVFRQIIGMSPTDYRQYADSNTETMSVREEVS